MKGKILRAVALRRSFALVFVLRRTELVLAGRSRSQIFADIGTALDRKELPALEPGAMCYMLSKQGYLSDRDGHWPTPDVLHSTDGARKLGRRLAGFAGGCGIYRHPGAPYRVSGFRRQVVGWYAFHHG